MTPGKNTILIDRSLQQEHKRNSEKFTIVHECSHQILHWAYYRKHESPPCRKETVQPTFTPTEWTDDDRIEWQANYLASALLIPLSALNKMIEERRMADYYQQRRMRGLSEKSALTQAAMDVAIRFGVSTLMAKIRLQSINFGKEIRDAVSIR
ncbi:MAG: ImmA/IrrE family metallo-endopeptidase [Chitinivibrionales bacterium]|nr:ImmA/IrrE family metallo-endopeptidase [Chitinivibrionales bacterium]